MSRHPRELLSHADPAHWVESQLNALGHLPGDASETVWGRYLMEDARRKAVYWRGTMEKLLSECVRHPEFEKAYGGSIAATINSLGRFIHALGNSWDDSAANAIIDFPRAKNVSGFDEYKEIRTRCRKAMKKAAAVFECTSAELMSDMEAVRPAVADLLRLVLDFDEAYGLAKRKRGIVDFSDLEHMTARLMTDRETGGPTALALATASRFREIMVDEYQTAAACRDHFQRRLKKRPEYFHGRRRQTVDLPLPAGRSLHIFDKVQELQG